MKVFARRLKLVESEEMVVPREVDMEESAGVGSSRTRRTSRRKRKSVVVLARFEAMTTLL